MSVSEPRSGRSRAVPGRSRAVLDLASSRPWGGPGANLDLAWSSAGAAPDQPSSGLRAVLQQVHRDPLRGSVRIGL